MQLKISLVHCLPGPNYRLLGGNYGLVAANDSLAPANHKMIRCGKGEMRLVRAFVGDFNPLSATGLKLIRPCSKLIRQAAKGIYAKFPPVANLWSAIYIMCIGFRCLKRRIGGEAVHTYTKPASRCNKLAPLRLTDGLIRDLADLT